MDVSPENNLLAEALLREKSLEGFSHLRGEVREEIGRFRERFRTRAIGLTSRVSAALPTMRPIDFVWGRKVMRGVLEEVAERGEGCALEVGLDVARPQGQCQGQGQGGGAQDEGDAFELSLRLFGRADRLAEIDRALEARLAPKKAGDEASVLETLREDGMRGWRVSFQAARAQEEEEPEAPAFRPGEAPEESFAREYPHEVLVVDDSAVGRRLTVQILRNLGYDPAQAHSGKDALKQARERRFTLIFMDLRMPDMDGIETMREIFRARPEGEVRPAVVALTAEISDVERNHCIDAGMADFLTKPCRPDELSHAIRTLSQKPLKAVIGPSVRPAPPWREAPVADEGTLRTLWEMPGGRLSTLLEDLFEALRREVPESLRLIGAAAKKEDAMPLRHEIHQLTGNFDVMGARRLALLCRAVGDCAKGGRRPEAETLIAEIPVQFEAFSLAVEAFVDRAKGRE